MLARIEGRVAQPLEVLRMVAVVANTRIGPRELCQGDTLLLQDATPLHGIVLLELADIDDVYVSACITTLTSAVFALERIDAVLELACAQRELIADTRARLENGVLHVR